MLILGQAPVECKGNPLARFHVESDPAIARNVEVVAADQPQIICISLPCLDDGDLPPAPPTPRERWGYLVVAHPILQRGVTGYGLNEPASTMPPMPSTERVAEAVAALCHPEVLAAVIDAMEPALACAVRRYASEAIADREAAGGCE